MEVDKDKYYNVNEITVQGLFPWIKSYGAVRRYISYDFSHGNSLEAQYKPSGSGKSGDRFYIKGVNIIKLLARYEDGSLFLSYEPKEKQNGPSNSEAPGNTGPTEGSVPGHEGLHPQEP